MNKVRRDSVGFDEVDSVIIDSIQKDAKEPLHVLGKKVGVSKEVISYRLKRLERSGVIEGYYAKINPAKVGRDVTMVIRVKCTKKKDAEEIAAKQISSIKGVTAVYRVFGPDDLIILARCKDLDDCKRVLYSRIRTIKYVRTTNTTVVHTRVKDTLEVEPHESCLAPKAPAKANA